MKRRLMLFTVSILSGLCVAITQDHPWPRLEVFQDEGFFKGRLISKDVHTAPNKNNPYPMDFVITNGQEVTNKKNPMNAELSASYRELEDRYLPNVISRTLRLVLSYKNIHYGEGVGDGGSEAHFIKPEYSTRLVLPAIKPRWIVSLTLQYSGLKFYHPNSFVNLTAQSLITDSTYTANAYILGNKSGELTGLCSTKIVGLEPGIYELTITFQDEMNNHTKFAQNFERGSIDSHINLLVAGYE